MITNIAFACNIKIQTYYSAVTVHICMTVQLWHMCIVCVVYSSACIVYSCQWHSIHVGVVYSVTLNCFQTRIIEA